MKKNRNVLPVLIVAVMCMMMLCSCKALDDARYNHGIYLDDAKKTVEYRDNRYTEINSALESYDGSVHFQMEDGSYLSFLQSGWGGGYITEKDVPVLLKNSHGDMINSIGGDEETPSILGVYQSDDKLAHTHYYCREDKEAEVLASLKHAEIDQYFLGISGWDQEGDRYVSRKALMEPSVKELIDRTLARSYNDKTDYLNYYDLLESEDLSEEFLSLKTCDKEMLFTDDNEIQIARTNGKSRKYYIALWVSGEGDPIYNDDGAIAESAWHLVEEKDMKVLDALFKQYPDDTEHFYFN